MSLPRFFLPTQDAPEPGALVALDASQARHLRALRLAPGAALEIVLPQGAWKADLATAGREEAQVRLVGPLDEEREAPFPIEVHLPLTAQLGLIDDLLPPLVELGATAIHLVAYRRSEADPGKVRARMDRWNRIIQGACEQSHRTRVPSLDGPLPFTDLLACGIPQRWVAYEIPAGTANPALEPGPVAVTSGPEGGIEDEEWRALQAAGWRPVTLGGSILRAVTCPVALLGAIRFLNP
jgi:16S rRNA (uracil1498-N3)-methyltransferase